MNRGVKTAADYAAIAVAPVLIFIMISSLVNFLSLVMYRGNFPERIQWTFLMVTLGSVAAARLSIEEDRSKSLMYLLALAGAALFVLLRFVANPVFSVVMLGLIAWLSDVIVRDCTLIDESKDSSDQGLIQTSRRGGHRPGRTVLFLAIAALPLFGVGQFFLRSHSGAWLGAQKLLALYLFAALSLLVTTSFLGLRRYLRQRGSEMPTNVTVAWLVGGLLMVMAILFIATLAPIPGQAIASMEMPDWMTATDDPKSSRYGWGNEGTKNESEGAAKIQSPEPKSEPPPAPGKEGAPPGAAKDGNASQGPAGQQTGGKQRSSGKGDSSQGQDSSQEQAKSKSGESKSSDKRSGENPSKDGKPQSSPEAKSSDSDAKTKSQADGPEQGDQGKSESKRSPSESSSDQKSPSSKSTSPEPSKESGDSPANGESSAPDEKQNTGESSEPSDSGEPQDAGKPSEASEPSGSDAPSEPAEPPQSGDPSDANEPSDSGDSSEDREPSDPSENWEPSDSSDSDRSTDESDPSPQEDSEPSESDRAEPDQSDESSETDEGSEPEPTETEEPSGPSVLMRLLALLAGALRPLILIACLGVVGYFLWQNWQAIANWWANLFRRDEESPDVPVSPSGPERPATPPRPFASFANPFQTSADPRQSVLVTFDALEAFARERGVARTADETPIEFYARMKSRLPELASGSSTVIDSYNRLLYGGVERPTAADLRAAEALWKQMLGGATKV